MAIVQISKIQHRTGANIDLPQLDIGEVGFATDTKQLFIGNDPLIDPPQGLEPTVTEIFTNSANCYIDGSHITGNINVNIVTATSINLGTWHLFANSSGIFVTNTSTSTTYSVNLTQV